MTLPEISERAASQIQKLMETLKPDIRDEYIPTVNWLVESSNANDEVPGPCIGLHRKSDVLPQHVLSAHGIAIAFNLPETIKIQLKDCVLDFIGNRYVFVKKEMAKFLGTRDT
jgi:hypothetical protein